MKNTVIYIYGHAAQHHQTFHFSGERFSREVSADQNNFIAACFYPRRSVTVMDGCVSTCTALMQWQGSERASGPITGGLEASLCSPVCDLLRREQLPEHLEELL